MSAATNALLAAALGGILVVAAGSKIVRPGGFLEFVRSFGTTERESRAILVAVATAEAVVGIALVARMVPVIAAAAALALAAGFVTGQLAALRAGVAGCGCFGALDPDDDGPLPLVRALALFALAAAVLAASLAANGPVTGLHASAPASAVVFGLATSASFVGAFALLGQTLAFEARRFRVLRY
jgi:hypothetical protein